MAVGLHLNVQVQALHCYTRPMKNSKPYDKPLVIFHTSELPIQYFLADTVYKASYARLAHFASIRGIDLRFVMGAKNYANGQFLSYGKYSDGTFKEIIGTFSPGMILLKSRTSLLDTERRVNSPLLEEICRDKFRTYQTFPKVVKKTVLASSNEIDSLSGESVVLKPRYGSEGRMVQLINKKALPPLSTKEEFILQEVIDSSQGIPNVVPSRHELRLYIFNGKIQSAYVRIPTSGSFLSNVSQGATVKLIDNSEIPESATKLATKIDAKFSSIVPRLYTIDLMFEQHQPWVVELNDMPGMPDVKVQPLADDYFNALLELMTDSPPKT